MQSIVRRILDRNPASLRALSRASGVPHATFIRVSRGELDLTPDATRKVVRALRQWAATCTNLANRLETADERRAHR